MEQPLLINHPNKICRCPENRVLSPLFTAPCNEIFYFVFALMVRKEFWNGALKFSVLLENEIQQTNLKMEFYCFVTVESERKNSII